MFELATRTDTRTELSMLNTDTRTRYRYSKCLRRVFCYRQQSHRRPTRAVQRQRSSADGCIPPPSRRGQPLKAGAGSAGLAAPSFTTMKMAPSAMAPEAASSLIQLASVSPSQLPSCATGPPPSFLLASPAPAFCRDSNEAGVQNAFSYLHHLCTYAQ